MEADKISLAGSPPQVRGKPDEVTAYQAEARITPAGAGKTAGRNIVNIERQDHPRRCGENDSVSSEKRHAMGSPPQVRGKLWGRHGGTWYAGITPAGAGKTILKRRLLDGLTDHPRRCGENLSTFRHHRKERGSPPQVRGKHCVSVYVALKAGITPAGAGKTSGKVYSCTAPQDHPRRCGENRRNTVE